MKPLTEMILLSEIILQSKIAQRAAERLPEPHGKIDQIETWCSIQSILIAAGNISKIIWPQKNKSRGEHLQHLLQLPENHLLSALKFRNHFVHYDERIETWFKNSNRAIYTDLSMNPSLRGSTASNDHRGYNSYNNTLVFRGETLDLGKVLEALKEIQQKCRPYTLLRP